MSGTQAIKMLESRAKDWYYVNPETHQELAATLREAKEIIGCFARDGADPDGHGFTSKAIVKERAERWLKE